ncbi:CHAT domain-containing protein [Streptomyces sp. NPDC093149]|uniref:CHAT domain-containing protein n=1 Tax=Streptomyces sp. NPDC093149 TaxID=3366031 RepID=UPI003805D9C2
MATESQCLDLLNGRIGKGLTEGVAEFGALGVALMHGLRPPLSVEELEVGLVQYARSRARAIGDPGLHPVFLDTFGSESLASFVTVFAPPAVGGKPGNLVARLLCATARGRCGGYSAGEAEVWLRQGLDIIGSEGQAAERGADRRAVMHMHIAGLDTLHRLAVRRRDQRMSMGAITEMVRLARQAVGAGMYEEAWHLVLRSAAWAAELDPSSLSWPDWLVTALLELESHEHLQTVFLSDLLSLAAAPKQDPRLAGVVQNCWATIRSTLASLATTMPAASRWRETAARSADLDDLLTFSLLDPARWTDPQKWVQALLPLFFAHPYEWRELKTQGPAVSAGLKAVASGATGAWVVNLTDSPASTTARFSADLHQALWRQPQTFASIVGPDGIRDALFVNEGQLDAAGFFPIVRAFNDVTRRRRNAEAFANITTVINAASAKLDAAQQLVRELPCLEVREDEMICCVGTLFQIPWELSVDAVASGTTARVCLDPRSTGLSRVEMHDVRISEASRVAIVDSGANLDHSRREVESIAAALGLQVESVNVGDLTTLQQAAQRYKVLHVIGHGTQSWRDPRENAIHLGRTPITAHNLARLDFTHVDLVVINACDAAAPGPWAKTGEATIAGALIAAGAKAVVAALWSVEDSCAAAFASGFYRSLVTGSSLPTAFHHAHEELRDHARSVITGPNSLLTQPYRLLIRGRGVG